ncbi:hypothetical protein Y032_0031g2383 [Ancylostoma ceylanicum]|uniref:GATOR2 complex protein WDR24 n=2 Tax=Ancylostoma ceylanicum TaxID=53326 RepID=A0A016UQU6_9BILA|nr:hypothetical protein Y032_0031g2383 [Ancylostoma ceylanicum]
MTSMGPLDIPNVRKKSAELYLHDYDLDDDLSIASPPVIKNMVDVDDPVDALSSNREQTHLVAAGCRGVLKVFKVNDEGFEQVIDLRSAKRRLNLFYSPSNVAWSKLKDELIATTSNNGAVVLWDVKKGGIERNYKSHTRSATVVHFHRSNEHLLISGSRDAAVLLYDLRENEPVKKFGGTNYDVIRDLSFCLHQDQHDQFVTSDDSGTIRLWDTRKGDRPLIQFPAHQGYAASIALNPRERHLIASGGGRDKFIKVWNWSGAHLNVPTYQVETTAPVGRVYWSPDPKNAFHIASCAVVNDMSVHIWDIRRPFLPYASFEDHSDSVTDIWWSAQHPERIVSCGKDGLLVLHWMDQKQSPLSYACDVALDIAPDGLIGVATNSHIPIIKQQEQFLARKRVPYDPFRTPVRSQLSCGLPDNAMNTLQPNAFYKLAEKYLAGGRPLRTLCNHNANLATLLGQSSVAQSWRLVGALLEQTGLQKVYDQDAENAAAAYREKYEDYVKEMERHGKKIPEPPRILTVWPTHLTRFAGHHSSLYRFRKEARLSPNSDQQYEFAPSNVASGDFYFGAGELTKTTLEKGIENPHYNDFTGLKNEAFALKPDLSKLMFMSMSSDDDGHLEKEHIARMNWNPMQEVVRLLRYHADQGDMQTCATLALVCGRRLSDVIDDFTVEAWKESYMGMLDQLDLHTAIAGVKKYSWIKRINQRSLEGTHFRLSHRGCTGQTLKCRCMKCYMVCGGTCSVCDGPLMHMSWFCRKCHHAGHPHHILEWFTTERICPVGDCLCECGTNVVQNQQGKKTAVPNNKALRELIRIRENCYLPTSSTNVHYENSSEDESDLDELTEKEVDEPLSRFSLGSDSSDSETSDSESSEPEELQPWQRNVTLPIERDLLELLQNSTNNLDLRRRICTLLFWLQFFRLIGPQFLHKFQKKQAQRKPDLEAQRQAYALFYRNQAKQGKENGARFPNEEIPKNFVELRGFISPLGSKYGPLNAKQTRDREFYERILNGENDPAEAEEVAEWERRSLAEYEENSRSSRKKSRKNKRTTGDETISRTSIYGQRNR